MSDTATPATPEKPKLRAIALRCVKGGGHWIYGDRYLAYAGHQGVNVTYFDIRIDQSVYSEPDDRFVPENLDHWHMFSDSQRLRFGPGARDHHLAYPRAERRAA